MTVAVLKFGTSGRRQFSMVHSSDHLTPLTGASTTTTLSLSGAVFQGITINANTIEVGNGWYSLAYEPSDNNVAGDLAWHITAASADPVDFVDQVQFNLPYDVTLDSSGNVTIANPIKKNQALNSLTFIMTDNVNHAPMTGLTVAAQRSLNGGALTNCINGVTELSNGVYTTNVIFSDMNGNTVLLRFTAPGADDLNIAMITQP